MNPVLSLLLSPLSYALSSCQKRLERDPPLLACPPPRPTLTLRLLLPTAQASRIYLRVLLPTTFELLLELV